MFTTLMSAMEYRKLVLLKHKKTVHSKGKRNGKENIYQQS